MEQRETNEEVTTAQVIAQGVLDAQGFIHGEVASMHGVWAQTYPAESAEEKKRAIEHFADLMLTFTPRLKRCVRIAFDALLESPKAEDDGKGGT